MGQDQFEFSDDLDNQDLDGDTGSDGQESGDGKQPEAISREDIEALKANFQKLEQAQSSWVKEREDYKAQLAEERRRLRALAGGEPAEDPRAKALEQAKNEEIKKRLFEVLPEMRELVEKRGENLGDKVYIQNAQREAMEIAKNVGFTSPVQQEAWCTLGDLIIHKTPVWHDRFYKQGDMSVLREVEAFMKEQIIGPFEKSIEARTIARIRKSGLGALPDAGAGSGASGASRPQKKLQVDVNNPEARQNAYANIMRRAREAAEG